MRAFLVYLIFACVLFFAEGCREISYKIEFTELETGTDASLRALHVVSNDIIWASGTGGTFLTSSDGGATWKTDTVAGASGDDLRSIHAWNDREAILFGISNAGRVYFTDDGGDSWKIVYENNSEGIFFDSAIFADELNGMALSDPLDSCSFVIRTSDKGKKWTRILNLPVLKKGEYNFAASNSCIDYHPCGNAWIVTGGADARVFATQNHGESWYAYDTGIISGSSTSGIFSVAFLNDKDGIIIGGTYDKPELNKRVAAYSSDGGVNWTLSGIMPGGFRSSVIWLNNDDESIAFALGKTGCDYSLDKGETWVTGPIIEGYYTARPVPGTLNGFAAGANGRVARFKMVL